MAILTHFSRNRTQADVAACSFGARWANEGYSPLVICPDRACVARIRNQAALTGLSFGVEFITLNDWLTDRWEWLGDGRTPIDSLKRKLIINHILHTDKSVEAMLGTSFGMVSALSNLIRDYLPYFHELPDEALSSRSLSPEQRMVCITLRRYLIEIEKQGLCEPILSCRAFASAVADVRAVFVGFTRRGGQVKYLSDVFAEVGECIWIEEECIADAERGGNTEACQVLTRLNHQQPGDKPIEPTGFVRFLLPSGSLASPKMVLAAITTSYLDETKRVKDTGLQKKPVVVVSDAANELARTLGPALFADVVAFSLETSYPLREAKLGRVICSLLEAVFAENPSVSSLSDFAMSPFSGISEQVAWKLDADFRARRALTSDVRIAMVKEASPVANAVLNALESKDFDGAFDALESHIANSGSRRAEDLSEDYAVLAGLRRFTGSCRELGYELLDSIDLIESLAILESATSGPDDSVPDVMFVDMSVASKLDDMYASALIVGDLVSTKYPVGEKECAADVLVGVLGIDAGKDSVRESRINFYHTLCCASSCVYLLRSLNNEKAEPTSPAVIYDDVIDLYRADLLTDDGLDRDTGLPLSLLPFSTTAGETEPTSLIFPNRNSTCSQIVETPVGFVSDEAKPSIVVKRSYGEDFDDRRLVMSPTAIESYLDCPYKWFASRRMRVQSLDASFGSSEFGSFAHEALFRLFSSLSAQGSARITASNIDWVQSQFSDIIDELVQDQVNLSPSENPLIALCETENLAIAKFKETLLAYLTAEIDFLPTFTPTLFEYSFDKNPDHFVEYAGINVTGTIDRVDRDDAGRLVIVDYKSSVSDSYNLNKQRAFKGNKDDGDFRLPAHVQSLIYAQVLHRELNEPVVGTIYVGYKKLGALAGAYDGSVIPASALPGIKPRSCSIQEVKNCPFTKFQDLLDWTEEQIAESLIRIFDGDIAPSPSHQSACDYCPITTCAKRITS